MNENDPDRIRAQIRDTTAVAQSMTSSVERLRDLQAFLRRKLARVEADARRVTDHAVVRYLERVFGIDMDKIRTDIRRMCDECQPFASCDGLWHTKGIVFVTNENGDVVTVLSMEQAKNYIGRRLANGERAAVAVNEGVIDDRQRDRVEASAAETGTAGP